MGCPSARQYQFVLNDPVVDLGGAISKHGQLHCLYVQFELLVVCQTRKTRRPLSLVSVRSRSNPGATEEYSSVICYSRNSFNYQDGYHRNCLRCRRRPYNASHRGPASPWIDRALLEGPSSLVGKSTAQWQAVDVYQSRAFLLHRRYEDSP